MEGGRGVKMGKSKGDRRENQAKNILEDAGYRVETPNYTRWENTDFFNLFDMMASKRDGLKFIQVKSNSTQGCLKEIDEACDFLPWQSDCIELEVWVCYDKQGWRVQRYSNDGWQVILDERDLDCNMGEHVANNI